MDRLPVELVRVPREEEVYDREQVFGRDATSVFPTESKTEPAGDTGTAHLALAQKRFISESELQTLRETRGARVEDGAVSVDKPLAEILRENKEKKEAEFQDVWKRMKQGKNRPLDEDEAEFFNTLKRQEAVALKQQRDQEEAELAEFRAALQSKQEAEQGGPDSSATAPIAPQTKPPSSNSNVLSSTAAKKPAAMIMIKPVAKRKEPAPSTAATHAAAEEPPAKQLKQADHTAKESQKQGDGDLQGGGLAGLLADYDDSDEGEGDSS